MSTNHLDLFYKSFLESLHLQFGVNDDGTLTASQRHYGEEGIDPFFCDGRRLALASHNALSNPKWETYTYFHPLCESTLRGESAVLKTVIKLVSLRLTSVTQMLLSELVGIAADTDSHARLNSKQHVLLSSLADVNDKTNATLTTLLKKMSLTGDNRLLSLYLKPSGEWQDQRWARVCTVRFPFMEELTGTDDNVFSVKLSKKDRASLINAMNFVLPNCSVEGTYSYGSNSITAPQFESLAKAYITVATALNKVTNLFKKHLDAYDELIIDLDWAGGLENITQWRESYPALPGNSGDEKVDTKDVAAKVNAAPKFSPNSLNGEVNSTPVAPVGNTGSHQAAPTLAEETFSIGGLTVKKNPLGNLGMPIPNLPGANGTPVEPVRTANGVVFSSLATTAHSPVVQPQQGWQQPQQQWAPQQMHVPNNWGGNGGGGFVL
jgi:hypothetical protein